MTTNERIDRLLKLNDQMRDELHSLRYDLMQPLRPPVIVPSKRDETAEEVAERNARQKQLDEEFYRTHPELKREMELIRNSFTTPLTNSEAEALVINLNEACRKL